MCNLRLALNSDPPVSASQMLGRQVCTSTPGLCKTLIRVFLWSHTFLPLPYTLLLTLPHRLQNWEWMLGKARGSRLQSHELQPRRKQTSPRVGDGALSLSLLKVCPPTPQLDLLPGHSRAPSCATPHPRTGRRQGRAPARVQVGHSHSTSGHTVCSSCYLEP
jgi:hypothetical protein